MLTEHPHITACTMDANSPEAATISAAWSGDVDLVYIDASHRYEPTVASFRRCGEEYGASFVVLDDITLNDEMSRFWAEVAARYGDEALDASALVPIREHGPLKPGFGVVRLQRSKR